MSTKPGGWNKLSQAMPLRPTDLRRELQLSSPPSPFPEAEHGPGDWPPWLRGPGAGVFSDTQIRHDFQGGAPCPLPGIFRVVFLLLGYFLFLGNPRSSCQQCFPLTGAERNQNGWGGAAAGRGFPEPSSRLRRGKSSSRLAVAPVIYPGEGPGSDSRGGGRLCWADTAPARSQFWDPGHLVMERVCVQMVSHTASPLPLPLGHEQHPSWKTGTKSETENSLAQTSSLEKP